MEKRWVTNLIALGHKEIFGFDVCKDRCKESEKKI
jgi:hypothetical protein